MLQKKIELGRHFLERHAELMRCPKCGDEHCLMQENELRCANGHSYSLSKKGTMHFVHHAVQSEYNQAMWLARRTMIQSGLYDPLLAKIKANLTAEGLASVLDVGSGEGSLLERLRTKTPLRTAIGFDLSKEGVQLATDFDQKETFWCVADLTNLPIASQRVSAILNIFSPSHYGEFERVLASGGTLIKVVPESGYLKELRTMFYQDRSEKLHYDNQRVVEKWQQATLGWEQREERLTYAFPVPVAQREAALLMSPIQWGASEESRQIAKTSPLDQVTVDVRILVAQKKQEKTLTP